MGEKPLLHQLNTRSLSTNGRVALSCSSRNIHTKTAVINIQYVLSVSNRLLAEERDLFWVEERHFIFTLTLVNSSRTKHNSKL